MPDKPSASEAGIVSPDRVRNILQAVLRAAQVDGWTDPVLEQHSGVSARAIKSYRVEGKEPSLSNALSLAVVLGPKAINSMLAVIGYSATPLDEPDEMNVGAIVASGLREFSVIATAAADGRIDHTEEPACREAADHIIATFLPLSSSARAE